MINGEFSDYLLLRISSHFMMVELIEPKHIYFSVWDYGVFIGALVISMAIGVYHAFKGNKTTSDFLMASRSMSPIPVALSVTATYLSSISILGNGSMSDLNSC